METKVNYTVVGVFVIGLIVAVIAAVLWLSVGFTHKEYNYYRSYMHESVTGLSIGSSVKFNGVNVGYVKDISLNPTNPQQVELLFAIENGVPITRDTTATLMTQGLTGVAYVDLQSHGYDNRPLVATSGETYPVIRTTPSLLLRLDTTINELTTNFSQVSSSLQKLLDAENRSAFKRILINMDKISSNLANNNQQMTALLENSETFMQALSEQTLPATNQMLWNLDKATRQISVLTQTLQQNPSVLIRGQEEAKPGPGEK